MLQIPFVDTFNIADLNIWINAEGKTEIGKLWEIESVDCLKARGQKTKGDRKL